MQSPFVPGLAGAVVLTLASLIVAPGTAYANDDCAPTIDAGSISVAPTSLTITSKGSKVLEASANFTAPCAEDDGSDLSAAAIFYTPDDDSAYVIDTLGTGAVIARSGDDEYTFNGSLRVRAGKLKNSDAGTWTTDVYAFDDQDQDTNDYVSEGATIEVLRAAKLAVNASPEPVKLGNTITIKGKLTRANWEKGKDGGYGHKAVSLQYKADAGSYTTIKTVTSSSKGELKASVKATEDGSFRFVFAGSSTTAATKSTSDHVDVQ